MKPTTFAELRRAIEVAEADQHGGKVMLSLGDAKALLVTALAELAGARVVTAEMVGIASGAFAKAFLNPDKSGHVCEEPKIIGVNFDVCMKAALVAALAEHAGEAEPDRAPLSVKAWRIKKGRAIPQWLEATDNVDLRAGCDLVVLEAKEGFDVYRADPGSFAPMMVGDVIDKSKPTKIRGSPTNLMAANRPTPPASAVREAAERVIWFDWSENDPDAVAAIDGLRAALAGSAKA